MDPSDSAVPHGGADPAEVEAFEADHRARCPLCSRRRQPQRPRRREPFEVQNPRDALRVHAELLRWWRSSDGVAAGDHLADLFLGASGLAGVLAENLEAAASFSVSSDVLSLLEAAARVMPDQALRPSDLPSPAGFVLLDREVAINDPADGQSLRIRAVQWSPTRTAAPGITTVWYCDGEDSWLGPVADRLIAPPLLGFVHAGGWRFGMTIADSNSFGVGEDGQPRVRATRSTRGMMTWLAALFAFLHQELVVKVDRVPRSISRSEERHPVPSSRRGPSEVRVVELRRVHRPATEPPEVGAVDWSHRWMVSGHWRAQWYPSLNDHRLIYINPYVKGPEDEPLLVNDVVFRVDR